MLEKSEGSLKTRFQVVCTDTVIFDDFIIMLRARKNIGSGGGDRGDGGGFVAHVHHRSEK